ncbi:integrin alpha-PS1 [Hyalella azteca]|uniref:Integrin alpha-PS1 n=1 Tax=Hyalella azteca TaxID=294128 RepID=A0A8B7P895_HYAAZ|nr:integrin alpha-PS1 [Hyalella azteca]
MARATATSTLLNKMCSMLRVVRLASLVMVWQVLPAKGFNLDTDYSLVLRGDNGTNFGYSVAMWHQAPAKYQRLVVGSPLFSSGSHDRAKGAVHYCHHLTGNCSSHLTSTEHFKGRDMDVLFTVDRALRADIGFGETLATAPASDQLLACAPRYPFYLHIENRFTGIFARGACVSLGQERPHLLIPVTERTDEARRINFIGRTAVSLAGFSAAATQSGKSYLGGPLAFNGQGAIFWESSGGFSNYPEESKGTHLDYKMEFWAVIVAKMDGTKEFLVASSPNKDDMNGAVSIYSMAHRELSPCRPRSGVSLTGAEFSAMYGYALAAGDWDGDGVADLAVGAPYTSRDTSADAGAVHITYGPLSDSVGRSDAVLRSAVEGAHFGLSLLNAGDLDTDGHEDLVVGAPDDGHGKVFIFNGSPDGLRTAASQILRGESALSTRSLQPARFGFSLSGRQDLDGNGCPDLLVGAVAADAALYVRSAPVLKIVGSLKISPSVVQLSTHATANNTCNQTVSGKTKSYTCFELSAALQYNSSVYNKTIEVSLSFAVDERYPFQRTLFWENNGRRLQKNVSLVHVSQPSTSFTILVYIKADRPSLKELVWASVNISMTRPRFHDTRTVPPLLEDARLEATARLDCKDQQGCSSKSDLQLIVEHEPLIIGGGRQGLNVTVAVKEATAYQIMLELKVPSMLSFTHAVGATSIPHCIHTAPSADNFAVLQCSLAASANQDTQLASTLYFDHSPVALLGAIDAGLVSGSYLPIHLNVSSDVPDLKPSDNYFFVRLSHEQRREVKLTGSSRPEQVRVLVNETLRAEQLLNPTTSSGSLSVEKLGPLVVHSYTISNRGPAPILHDQIILEWPRSIPVGPNLTLPLLYITEEPSTKGPVTCLPVHANELNFSNIHHSDEEILNDASFFGEGDLEIQANVSTTVNGSSQGPFQRRKRSMAHEDDEATASGRSARIVVPSISCALMECYVINCSLTGLLAGEVAQVSVKGRVAVAALQKKHRNILMSSQAELQSTGDVIEIQTSVTLIPPPVRTSTTWT